VIKTVNRFFSIRDSKYGHVEYKSNDLALRYLTRTLDQWVLEGGGGVRRETLLMVIFGYVYIILELRRVMPLNSRLLSKNIKIIICTIIILPVVLYERVTVSYPDGRTH
jgi:hypothetical protein